MKNFWEYPTVSMGLSPLMSIYQARFNRYLHDRELKDTSGSRVWAFLGDGEMDEPESMGSLTVASREKLDNLTFVINCNLQRLDGPVRGNGKIIQELESLFRGAGWNVIKVIWGRDWDPLLAQDEHGYLAERMNEAVDGDYQKYVVAPGSYTRQHFFGKTPELSKMVEHLSDEQIRRLGRGGHDAQKVNAAYKAAIEHRDRPTVVLCKTIKGYGLGEAGEGRNITHQQKKMNEAELRFFRDRFDIPISDKDLKTTPFYRPSEDSEEVQYLVERRRALGGFVPQLRNKKKSLATMAFTSMLSKLLRHERLGKFIVPIIPDEARTFGMDPLFRQVGIYSGVGQLYEPVDSDMLLYYREAKDGQLIEEGISEAGAGATFAAAGTCDAAHGVPMIPFYTFYSMFGFQRIGDLIWAMQDMPCRGFLLGATSGRTTLNGEGLQHQDGHTPLFASAYPRVRTYEPAFAADLLVMLQQGIYEMYERGEDVIYYLTLQNENYEMPPLPEGVEDGIIRGIYLFQKAAAEKGWHRVQLLGSGSILMQVLRAQKILAERYQIAADVWNVTSYSELRREALEIERWNMMHPQEKPYEPYIVTTLKNAEGPIIAASDWMRVVPDQLLRWVPKLFSLGTDGLGRSDSRAALRRFFEVDAESIVIATLTQLKNEGKIKPDIIVQAMNDFGFPPDKPDPMRA